MEKQCIVCSGYRFTDEFNGEVINNYTLKKCTDCGMVLAFPVSEVREIDYSNYGDYLILGGHEIQRRVSFVKKEMSQLFHMLKKQFINPKILDFGCGAGYFCKAAQEAGFNVIGVEVSDKLVSFCKNSVNFHKVFNRIEHIEDKFDAIFMLDVIEHLNPFHIRRVMTEIIEHLKPNGLLIGNTPNFNSANIILCKSKDPVIWPPSHLCYFNLDTLDKFLSTLGLNKVKLYSSGVSSNGFFRKTKFERSFLEKNIRSLSFNLIPASICIRVIFRLLGFIMRPFDLGYQIQFIYRTA